MSIDINLKTLARFFGIQFNYINAFGEKRDVPETTVLHFLRAFGVEAESPEKSAAALEQVALKVRTKFAPPLKVVEVGKPCIRVVLGVPQTSLNSNLAWRFLQENGGETQGAVPIRELRCLRKFQVDGQTYLRIVAELPLTAEAGYHQVFFDIEGSVQLAAQTAVIVAPTKCYLPAELANGKRYWGLSAQLYSVSSARNWGIGDFTDLSTLIEGQRANCSSLLGLNPLHALPDNNAAQQSPYSPISRTELNFLFTDIDAIPEVQESDEAQECINSPTFQERLSKLREAKLLNYAAVRALKLEVLEKAFSCFVGNHLQKKTDRGKQFQKYVKEAGENLDSFARFQALSEHFRKKNPNAWGWLSWPDEYRDCRSAAVLDFVDKNSLRVSFFKYVQWQTHLQLSALAERVNEGEMAVGLYLDLALGSDKSGAEVWRDRSRYILDADVGAPPDGYSAEGQCWGFPPYHPLKLREESYQPFVAALRAAMRYAAAVRIDHAMSLQRLFWIPSGKSGTEGTYVKYRLQEMMAIVCLESQRNKCLVIGEDLGTVPEGFRDELERHDIYSYKLLAFMRDFHGGFSPLSEYPAKALVTGSTHDSPTLWGYFRGDDIALRHKMGLIETDEARDKAREDRRSELTNLLNLLDSSGALKDEKHYDTFSGTQLNERIFIAVQQFLASTACQVMVTPIEDIIEQYEQVNVPGITDKYPSWQHRLQVRVEQIASDPRFKQLAEALATHRQ